MFDLWILVVAFLGTNPIHKYVSGGTETMQTCSSVTPQTKTQIMESTKTTYDKKHLIDPKKTTIKNWSPPIKNRFQKQPTAPPPARFRFFKNESKVPNSPNDTTWVLESSYQIKQWWDHYLKPKNRLFSKCWSLDPLKGVKFQVPRSNFWWLRGLKFKTLGRFRDAFFFWRTLISMIVK